MYVKPLKSIAWSWNGDFCNWVTLFTACITKAHRVPSVYAIGSVVIGHSFEFGTAHTNAV